MKAAASATNRGEQGNRRKGGNPQFISNFEVCENHSQPPESNFGGGVALADSLLLPVL